MKILSWNVNMVYGKNNGDLISRSENIIISIKKINPDILLLQEASRYFLKLLKELGYIIKNSLKSHCGFTVTLTKSSLEEDVKNIEVSNSLVYVKIKGISIFNTHLSPGPKSYNQRLNELHNICSITEKNIIIMGDMNMNNDEIFETETIKDVGKIDNIKTWNYSFFLPGSLIKKRFDRIFTDTLIYNFQVYKNLSGQSDHLPISMEI